MASATTAASTEPSSSTAAARGRPPPAIDVKRRRPTNAITTPSAAPAAARIPLSINAPRKIAIRDAPSAPRTPASRVRSVARASIRFAMFMHATSSAAATPARSISRPSRLSPVTHSCSGISTASRLTVRHSVLRKCRAAIAA